jgi:hypothetical protein
MAADGYAQTAFPDRDAELLEVASMAPPSVAASSQA